MKNLTPEMVEKAKAAKSAEELLAFAKENGVEMTEDEAATYFAQLNPKSGELDDDELDNVAGGTGSCGDPTNKDIFPAGTKMRIKRGACRRCNGILFNSTFKYATPLSGESLVPVCDNCGTERGSYLCKARDMSDDYEAI